MLIEHIGRLIRKDYYLENGSYGNGTYLSLSFRRKPESISNMALFIQHGAGSSPE
jgi:hypothetical protein